MDKLWKKLTSKSDKKTKKPSSSTEKKKKPSAVASNPNRSTLSTPVSSKPLSSKIHTNYLPSRNSYAPKSGKHPNNSLNARKDVNFLQMAQNSSKVNPFEPILITRKTPVYSAHLISDLSDAFGVPKLPQEVLQILAKSLIEEHEIYENFFTFLTCLYYTSPKKLLKRPKMRNPPIRSSDFIEFDSLTELSSDEADTFSTRLLKIPFGDKSKDTFSSLERPKRKRRNDVSLFFLNESQSEEQTNSNSKSSLEEINVNAIPVDEMKMLARHYQSKKCGARSKRKHFLKNEINQLLSTKNPNNFYTSFREIGKGSYGKVFSAVDRTNKSLKAIKKMNRSLKDDCDNILNEIHLLKNFNHPNITAFVNTFHWDEHIWIVMELADAGTLKDALVVEFKEKNIRHILRELVHGIEYMHKNDQIHRDLKSSNILLKGDGRIQIADFGLCVPRNKKGLTGMAGSKYWMAPEMILRIPYFEKVDIWSLGAVGIETLTGKPPYNNYKPVRALFTTATKGISLEEFKEKFSKNLIDFLDKCFIRNPERRYSATQLSNHPFLFEGVETDQFEFTKVIKLAKELNSK